MLKFWLNEGSFFLSKIKRRLNVVINIILIIVFFLSFIILKITKKNEPSWFTTAPPLFFDNLRTSLDLSHLLWALPESSTVLSKAVILNGKTCATLKNLVHLLVLWNVIFNSGRNTFKRWISLEVDFECWCCFCWISFTFRLVHHYNGCKFIRKLFLFDSFQYPSAITWSFLLLLMFLLMISSG